MKYLSKLAFLILAIAALARVAIAAPVVSKQTVLLVTQARDASWEDFAFLAAVPATRKANQGNGAVIALDETGTIPREVDDYFKRLKPSRICHLGANPLTAAPQFGKYVEMPCTSADQAATVLADAFWSTSARVVMCSDDNYASALMASALAARLQSPLLFCGEKGLSPQTTETLKRLQSSETIFVGRAPAALKATELPNITSVLMWLKKQKLDTPYLALANVRDRTSTTIRKLSLTAPIFAAAHDGMVVPFNTEIQWRTPISGKPLQGDLPKGIPAGSKPPNAGTIDLAEGKVPFVLSYGPNGNTYALSLDLDRNGTFNGPGEGPLKSNGVVTLLGKPRTINFGQKYGPECDLTVTTGTAEDIFTKLRKLYAITGIPRYVCIVGFPDSIPQAILTHGDTDITSDLPYAGTDDDLFSEIAVGRIIGEDATFATLHASRTVTYDALLDLSWATKAGQSRWENTLGQTFMNVGLNAAAHHDIDDLELVAPETSENKGERARSISQNSPLTQVAFISHMDHSWWQEIGHTFDMDCSVLTAPAVVESGGCSTCYLDNEPGFRSVISRIFRNGAISFCGQTRPGIAQQEQQRVEFWNSLLTGESIGEAHRYAQNSKATLVLDSEQAGGGPDHYQLHICSLFGDPAFKPHLPSAPQSAAANTVVKGDTVRVKAPANWWKTQIRVPEDWKRWADKPLYVIRGSGTYPNRHWCGDQFDLEEIYFNAQLTTTRRIKSITQVENPTAPLGWTGKHTVDENPDGSHTYRWRVRMIDFDQKTGVIASQLDHIDYKIKFEP
jgi:hypothetical protein